MAAITVRSVSGDEKYYPLGKATVVIGRGEQVKVQVVDDHVSQKHLQIRCEQPDGVYYALDMQSKNGTSVNGRQITSDVRLQHGDLIKIGGSTILFEEHDIPDRTNAFQQHKQPGQRDRGTMMR